MDNATRRQLLQRHKQSGFTGSILDVYNAYNQGVDLIGQFEQQNNIGVAESPQQQQQGLRPAHQAGDINKSMVFPDVPPNTTFNTEGMKAPINIEKYDEQGHLVKSYENVPPGVRNLPTGPQRGTVIETPARMQGGGFNDTMQQYANMYNKFNPEGAAAMANMPERTPDRLTSYTDAEMTRNENRQNALIDQAGLNTAKDVAGNVVQYHKDKPLDALGMDLAVLGQVPIVGEVADLANAGISGARGIYNTVVGDTAKANEQFALAGLSAASAIPIAGNAVGGARIVKAGHNIAHKAHNLEKGVIGAKGIKAGSYEAPAMQAGGPRKLQNAGWKNSYIAESTAQPSFAEQAFLNQQNALPALPLPRYKDEGTIREGNFEVDKDNNIVEDRPSFLEMAANPMATARAIIDPSVEGLPSQVEFDQSKDKGNMLGQAANDIVNPAAWVNYGVNAYQDFGDATKYAIQGEGQKALQAAGSGAMNVLGAVPGVSVSGGTAARLGKQALNATAGQAARNVAYNMVTPMGYKPRFLSPKEILKNVTDPMGRPARTAERLVREAPEDLFTINPQTTSDYLQMKTEQIARRLDAFALGLGKTPRYNTLQKTGDNLYEPIDAGWGAQGPPVTVGPNFQKQVKGALSNRIFQNQMKYGTPDLGKRGSTIGYSDGTYELMGGYHLVDEAVPNNPMLRRITMNDTWDLHPFSKGAGLFANSYPATKKIWDVMPRGMQNTLDNKLKNTEVLSALGGKPINIKSRWTAELPQGWDTQIRPHRLGDIKLTHEPPSFKTGGIRKMQAAGFNTAESTARPNYAEQAFLNLQNAVPPIKEDPLEKYRPSQTSVKEDTRTDSERKAASERIEKEKKREEAIEKGINPNLAFMMPPGLQGDPQAIAAYQYDNPLSSPIGTIATGIAGIPIDIALGAGVGYLAPRVSSAAPKAINLSKSAMPKSMQILKLQNQAARMPRSMRQAELDFIDNAKNTLNTARREDMGAISALKNQADDVIRQTDDLYNPTRIQERLLTPLDPDRIDVTRYLANQPISRNRRGGFTRKRR